MCPLGLIRNPTYVTCTHVCTVFCWVSWCSFFIIQLSSMITGWCAIAALTGPLPKGTSVFSAVLLKVAGTGTGQAILASLLLASGALQYSLLSLQLAGFAECDCLFVCGWPPVAVSVRV